MAEYKCGDCFYADLCEESEILDGFNRDNPAYCSLFLNSADVAPVRHGRWVNTHSDSEFVQCCLCKYPVYAAWNVTNYCPNCGADMRGSNDE